MSVFCVRSVLRGFSSSKGKANGKEVVCVLIGICIVFCSSFFPTSSDYSSSIGANGLVWVSFSRTERKGIGGTFFSLNRTEQNTKLIYTYLLLQPNSRLTHKLQHDFCK